MHGLLSPRIDRFKIVSNEAEVESHPGRLNASTRPEETRLAYTRLSLHVSWIFTSRRHPRSNQLFLKVLLNYHVTKMAEANADCKYPLSPFVAKRRFVFVAPIAFSKTPNSQDASEADDGIYRVNGLE
jgi:hypothetical protein